MSERPVRVYFVADDPAALWRAGDTADDRGADDSGRHLLKLDHFDDSLVSIEDPYGRGIIKRLDPEAKPKGFSDAELDAYLDQLDDKEDSQ
jgi:uncharacterized protein YvpB